jgi:acetyl esterase
MALDPGVRRFLELLAAAGAGRELEPSVSQRRIALAGLLRFSGEAPPVAAVDELDLAGPGGAMRLRFYRPAAAAGSTAAILYLHGGGLVAGSLDTHDVLARSLALASGAVLVAVDYRLAPEHRFPAALEDARHAAYWLAANAADFHIDAERIAIVGDSAGGTLAAALCQELAGGAVRPRALGLLCPITDYGVESESRRQLAEGYLLERATLAHDLKHYLPEGLDITDPRVSPLRAPSFAGLPPAVVHTAEFDPLRDEGAAYAERLRAAGVTVRYHCHGGMIHLFYALGGVVPYAREAVGRFGGELAELIA